MLMADEERSQNNDAQHANSSNMAVACDSRNACGSLEHSVTNIKTSGRKVATQSNGYIKHNYDENNLIHVVNKNASVFGKVDDPYRTPEAETDSDRQSKNPGSTVSDVSYQEKVESNSETSCCKIDCDSVHNCCDSTEPCAATNCVDSVTDQLSHTSLSDSGTSSAASKDVRLGIEYVVYESELQMPDIMRLITKDLSEPYSIYTYRYFIHNWPKLCFLAMDGDKCVGAIVCKLDMHKKMVRRGYIAMLAIDNDVRRRGIGSHLVMKAIQAMVRDDCDEVVLETEVTNKAALRLYENLGFVHDKRLFRYYLNGVDALRLKLWLR